MFFRKSSTAKTDHGFITATWQPNCREFSGTVQLGEFLCPLNSGKNWITIPSLMSNSNFVSFHSQAWESTYTKWQKLTFDLVNFGKDDSPSIDVQKYLRRRSHAKITTDNLQVHLYTFNFLATIRDQDRIYPFNIKQTFGCNSEKYKGIVNRSNTKFCDIHYKDCKSDSNENYYWDLGSERVDSNLWIV